jgi:hypothetical protein
MAKTTARNATTKPLTLSQVPCQKDLLCNNLQSGLQAAFSWVFPAITRDVIQKGVGPDVTMAVNIPQ